jgi:hypothetical protein
MNNLSSKEILIKTLKNITYKLEHEDDNKNIWLPGEKLKTIKYVFDLNNTNSKSLSDNDSSDNNSFENDSFEKDLEYISLAWYLKNISST